MNPFGWKKWKEVPYRGDGLPRDSKPRRRHANLKKERREFALLISIIMVVFFCAIGFALTTESPNGDDSVEILGLIIIAVFVVTLIAAIARLYKYRKGYDIDISDEKDQDTKE